MEDGGRDGNVKVGGGSWEFEVKPGDVNRNGEW